MTGYDLIMDYLLDLLGKAVERKLKKQKKKGLKSIEIS